ncbi:MAG TPA: hypothetical protein VI457_01090 [Methylococcaceae bacterium]|nr:hypothetical protein [Methylococcaceae bacterium]
MSFAWLAALVLGGVPLVWSLRRRLASERQAFLDGYAFHPAIRERVRRKRPALDDGQLDLVFQGLRDYFQLCRKAGHRRLAMPSQAVDDAWHEFILFTRAYDAFCRRALGRYLHHTPVEAMASPTHAEEGIKRAWRLACSQEGIDPRQPERLPLLFALDAQLGIADGFHYSLNCRDKNSPVSGTNYCASHIGCTSGCSGDSGAATDSAGSGDSCGDGGSGCGGGGCGGGGD